MGVFSTNPVDCIIHHRHRNQRCASLQTEPDCCSLRAYPRLSTGHLGSRPQRAAHASSHPRLRMPQELTGPGGAVRSSSPRPGWGRCSLTYLLSFEGTRAGRPCSFLTAVSILSLPRDVTTKEETLRILASHFFKLSTYKTFPHPFCNVLTLGLNLLLKCFSVYFHHVQDVAAASLIPLLIPCSRFRLNL